VSLPTPWAIVGVGRFNPTDFPHVFEAYEQAMLLEVERLCRSIPHADLAIQWDVAHEMIIFDGRWQAPYEMWRPFPDMGGVFSENIARVAAAVPNDVELGLHLCYGDRDAHYFIEPVDASKLVEFSTLVVERLPRTLNWIHMPVGSRLRACLSDSRNGSARGRPQMVPSGTFARPSDALRAMTSAVSSMLPLHYRCWTSRDSRVAELSDRVASTGLVTRVESRAGAVADRSGAVHASCCRRCGPETVLRLQSPLINPGVQFSCTRLSESFHRASIGAAVYRLAVPTKV
jgi:hypothetical protein